MGKENCVGQFLKLGKSPEAVWRIFTEAEQLQNWLGTSAQIDLREGGSLSLDSVTPFVSGQHTIAQFIPQSMLVLNWQIGDVETRVEIKIEAEGSGSKVEVRHFVAADAPLKLDHPLGGPLSHLNEMWIYNLGLLKTYVELGEAKCRLRDGKANERRQVEHQMSLDASPEEVFGALTDPEKVKLWNPMATNPVSDNKVGGRYSFGWETEAKGTDGPHEIVEYEQDRKLTYSWHGNGLVSWAIEPLPGSKRATKLTLVHSGFSDAEDITVGYNLGWGAFLQSLAMAVEQGVGGVEWFGFLPQD